MTRSVVVPWRSAWEKETDSCWSVCGEKGGLVYSPSSCSSRSARVPDPDPGGPQTDPTELGKRAAGEWERHRGWGDGDGDGDGGSDLPDAP